MLETSAYNLTVQHPLSGANVIIGEPLIVGGTVTGRGGAEIDGVESVTVQFEGETPMAAELKSASHSPTPASSFIVELPPVTGPPRPVSIVVQATYASGKKTSEPISVKASIWSLTGFMNTGRIGHTATALPNGMVLAHGGSGTGQSPLFKTAELYDPATGTWVPTGPSGVERFLHSETLLTSGEVLAVGGQPVIRSTELFDAGAWSSTVDLTTAREQHAATLLADGKVLVVGGSSEVGDSIGSCEIFNPVAHTWSPTLHGLNISRFACTATLLLDDRVLVVGGWGPLPPHPFTAGNTAELFNPTTEVWTLTDPLFERRILHTATRLQDGKVLVAGGFGANSTGAQISISDCEIFVPDSGSGQWIKTSTMNMNVPRAWHTATLLPDGKVLVVGGLSGDGVNPPSALGSSELFDPATDRWTLAGDLNTARTNHTETLLSRRSQGLQQEFEVLVVGGYDASGNALSSAEFSDLNFGR
jgi:hypothetical protein